MGKVCRKHSGTYLALFKLCYPESLPWPALTSIPLSAIVSLKTSKMPASSKVGNWPVYQGLWPREGLGWLMRCVRSRDYWVWSVALSCRMLHVRGSPGYPHRHGLGDGGQNPRRGGRTSTSSGGPGPLYLETWESTVYLGVKAGPSWAWVRLTSSQDTYI